MWFAIMKFLIWYVILPALGIVPATLFTLRTMKDPEPVMAFAASSGGGNFLLWMIVIGLVINALVNAKIPQFEAFKVWLLSKLAGWLAGVAAKMEKGAGQ